MNVSVVIPCYKQAHYLPQAVDSLLAQSVPPAEIVVVDDGSPDETAEVASRYGPPVRLLRKVNAGLSAARNTGILCTTGEWLVFLDADDWLPPNAIERHLAAAAERPDIDVFHAAAFHHVDPEGQPTGEGFRPGLDSMKPVLHELLRGNVFPPHAVMVRRAALANAGLFDVHLRSYEDWDMWLRLAAAGCRFAPTTGLDVPYRQHPQSMSRNAARMYQTGLAVLAKASGYVDPHCRTARRLIVNARWGLRARFLRQLATAGETAWTSRVAMLARLTAADPPLPLAQVRGRAQILRHKLFTRRISGGVAT